MTIKDAHGTSKDLACKKEKLNLTRKYNNTKIFDFDDVTKENLKDHNPKWLQIADHNIQNKNS